ncbi:MAG: O-antigen ligase family protein [Puniceicoccales bacterium]|jgi:hypothetical protein|nr:O-antigen ligase family protein [Puniceicoccales bacterium]
MSTLAVALSSRLDWGLGNPNKTAALIVLLMMAIWGLPSWLGAFWPKAKEALWWIALLGSLGLGCALLQTGSRGGLVAAVTGWLVMLCFGPRPWPWRKIAGAMGAFVAALILMAVLPQAARLSPLYGVHDASIGNRWILWQSIPSMILAAPGGWGLGNSGEAFMTWYQSADRGELYRTLVNSHGTWLVELGWLGRIGYLGGWVIAFCLAWPTRLSPGKRLSVVPLGVLTAFAVSALFSSVAETWVLWLIPLFALIFAILMRRHAHVWPKPAAVTWSLVGSFVVMGMAVFFFSDNLPLYAHDSGKSVQLGRGDPRLVIVAGEGAKESPRQLRIVWQKASSPVSVLWTTCPRDVSIPEGHTLALLGNNDWSEIKSLLDRAQTVVLLAPSSDFDNLPPEVLRKTHVYFGEFMPPVDEAIWREAGHFEILPGQAAFIGDWPERLLKIAGESKSKPLSSPQS